jgi:hypothetical protein
MVAQASAQQPPARQAAAVAAVQPDLWETEVPAAQALWASHRALVAVVVMAVAARVQLLPITRVAAVMVAITLKEKVAHRALMLAIPISIAAMARMAAAAAVLLISLVVMAPSMALQDQGATVRNGIPQRAQAAVEVAMSAETQPEAEHTVVGAVVRFALRAAMLATALRASS